MTPGTQFWMHVILRVCDFFDVVKNRSCKQNSYDDKLVINSKKSQTLSGVSKLDTPIQRTLIPLSSTLRALTTLPRVQVNRGWWPVDPAKVNQVVCGGPRSDASYFNSCSF